MMKKRVKSLPTNLKVFCAVLLIFILAVIDYRWFLAYSQKLELYSDLSNDIVSVRMGLAKIEYTLDMFVAAKRFENTTVGMIRRDLEKLDKIVNEVFENKKYEPVVKSDVKLTEGVRTVRTEWQTIKSEILRLNEALPPDEVILIHNAVDVNAILINEMNDRLLAEIDDDVHHVFEDTKSLALKSILIFMLMWLSAALVFYKRIFLPVSIVSSASRRIAGGDKTARFDDTRRGFISSLSEELNFMVESLGQEGARLAGKSAMLEKELGDKKRQIDALNLLPALAGRSLSQAEVFSESVREALASGGAEAAAIYLFEDGKTSLKASAGAGEPFFKNISEHAKSVLPHGHVNAVLFKTVDDCPNAELGGLVRNAGFSSLIAAPMTYAGASIGCIVALKRTAGGFNEDSVPFFEAIGAGLGVTAGYLRHFHKERLQRQFFERLVNQLPYGMAVFDLDGACLAVNGALRGFLGAHPDFNFIGDYKFIEDEHLKSADATAAIKRAYEGYSSEFSINYNPALVMRYGFSGTPRSFRVKSVPIYGPGGEVANVMLVYDAIK